MVMDWNIFPLKIFISLNIFYPMQVRKDEGNCGNSSSKMGSVCRKTISFFYKQTWLLLKTFSDEQHMNVI